jgi:DNA polymerase V
VPVSIGIGPTKTLAKVASYSGKKKGLTSYDLRSKEGQSSVLEGLNAGDLWGVGKRIALRLNQIGIFKASQLRDSDYKMIRKSFEVIGEKIVHELRGISCLELETLIMAKKYY